MIMAQLSASFVDRIGWLLVHSVWQFALVALVLAVVLRIMQRRSASARYWAAVLGWAVMVTAPAVTWMLLPGVRDVDAVRPGAPVTVAAAADAVAAPALAESPAEAVPMPRAADRSTVSGERTAPAVLARSAQPWWVFLEAKISPWLHELVAIWCLGVLLFGLRPACGWYTLRRLRRTGVSPVPSIVTTTLERASRRLGQRREIRVLQSKLVNVPLVAGYFRPVILLPLSVVSGLSTTQVEAVLAHELAHIRRHDYLVNLLQTLSETIFFYHPAVWWVSKRIRHEREHCCDELAATALGSRVEYGRALLALEELRHTAPVLSLGATGGSLLKRIQRLAGVEPSRRSGVGGLASLALAGLMLIGVGIWTGTQAQEASTDSQATRGSAPDETEFDNSAATGKPASPNVESRLQKEADPQAAQGLTVNCVDSQGQPVAGAEVYLFQHNGGKGDNRRYVEGGPFTSDAQGQAACDKAIVRDEFGYDRWIYARVPDRLVGVARSVKWKGREAFNPELRVELYPSRSVDGQVNVPQGFDPTQVTVRVQTLHVDTGPGDFNFESFPREAVFAGLDTALPEIFERRPDAGGRIRFSDVPVRGRLYLITLGKGLGEAQWMNEERVFDEPIRLNIVEEGSLTGRVLLLDGKPAAGMEVTARLASGRENRIYYLSTFRVLTSETGDFAISGLPECGFTLSVRDPQDRWTFRPRESLLVASGEKRDLALAMETGVLVTGRVLDPEGNPVEGAGFSVVTDTHAGVGLADDSTDADGWYEFRLPAGGARLYFNSLPDGLAYPRPQIVKELDIRPGQAPIENLDFTLQRRTDDGG